MNNFETIPNFLIQRAFLTPDRIALSINSDEITFSELDKRVRTRARKFSYIGMKQGVKVALLMKNSIEMVETIHALKYIGAITIFLNTRLSPRELEWQINDSGAQLLLTEEDFTESVVRLFDQLTSSNIITLAEVFELPERDCSVITEFALDEVDTIMYTSGTTGNPKGVMHTYGNHWWSAVGSVLNLGLHHDDYWLAAVPFFHISGLSILMRSVIYGIPVEIQQTFDAKEVNQAIITKGVTIVSVVSAMLSQMVENLSGQTYPHTFRCMLLGGGPAPKPLLEKCRERSIPVYQTYGMTETASQIVTLPPEYSLQKLGSAGKPLFPAQVKIENEGKSTEANRPGEIVVKGPNVTRGYLNRNDATEKAIKNGWLYTGDIGYLDNEGFLYVIDRRSDLIISGGENIYPAEIEAVLLSHEEIVDAGVTGIRNEKWGHVPCAFIKIRKEGNCSIQEVIHYCEERLARYKVPKEVYIVDNLPRNASKKLLRRKLVNLIPIEGSGSE